MTTHTIRTQDKRQSWRIRRVVGLWHYTVRRWTPPLRWRLARWWRQLCDI